jgi:hypothetical protein
VKRIAAIILSLTFAWLQVTACPRGDQISGNPDLPQCGCCVAKQNCCCIESGASARIPAKATPPAISGFDALTIVPSRAVIWVLPANERIADSSFDSTTAVAGSIPLFRRDCALLI